MKPKLACSLFVLSLFTVAGRAHAIDVAYILNPGNPGDRPILDYLELDRGFNVQIISHNDDDASTLESSDAADLTIVSESVQSGNVNFKVTDSTTPIVTTEPFLYDELGFVNEGDQDSADPFADITIINPSHPLAAGLPAGDVEIFDEPGEVAWGVVGGEVTIIATTTEDPTHASLFVYEAGALLHDGTRAAALRIGLPHSGLTLAPRPMWTDEGKRLYETAIDYALGLISAATQLQAGDADQDLDFDQLDLVKVQIAAKYLTGQPATWGEGDWDSAPGGEPGNPPEGNGLFDQLDIIGALASGFYLTGPYGAIGSSGSRGDGQTSIVYDAATGEVEVDAPVGVELTSINVDSAAAIFTGAAAVNLGGSFDNDADNNIFKATFGGSFGSISLGNVAQPGLDEAFLTNDLTVVGSLAGGGDLGNVDLIYVPEPSAVVLLGTAFAGLLASRWRLLIVDLGQHLGSRFFG